MANERVAAVGHGSATAAVNLVHQVHHQQLIKIVGAKNHHHQVDASGVSAAAISACMAERNGYKPAHLTMELLYR